MPYLLTHLTNEPTIEAFNALGYTEPAVTTLVGEPISFDIYEGNIVCYFALDKESVSLIQDLNVVNVTTKPFGKTWEFYDKIGENGLRIDPLHLINDQEVPPIVKNLTFSTVERIKKGRLIATESYSFEEDKWGSDPSEDEDLKFSYYSYFSGKCKNNKTFSSDGYDETLVDEILGFGPNQIPGNSLANKCKYPPSTFYKGKAASTVCGIVSNGKFIRWFHCSKELENVIKLVRSLDSTSIKCIRTRSVWNKLRTSNNRYRQKLGEDYMMYLTKTEEYSRTFITLYQAYALIHVAGLTINETKKYMKLVYGDLYEELCADCFDHISVN